MLDCTPTQMHILAYLHTEEQLKSQQVETALLISLSEETPYTPYLTSGDISICPFNQIPLAQWTDGMVTKVFLKRFDMCATKAGVIHVILELFCIVLADASAPDKTQAKEYIIFFSSPLSYFFFNYYLIKREMQYCNYF